jgi:hypothetical protein
MIDVLLLETVYALLIVFSSYYIFRKIWFLYQFSRYRGLKYLASAFFFLSAGFVARYGIMMVKIFSGDTGTIQDFGVATLIMESFLILPGLLIFYSLVWRSLEKHMYSSRFNYYYLFILCLSFIFALVDMFFESFYGMYISQILLFFVSAVLVLTKYLRQKNNFLQLYFISMILFFLVWVINFFAQYTIGIIPYIRLYAYLCTLAGCIIFVYITHKLTRVVR